MNELIKGFCHTQKNTIQKFPNCNMCHVIIFNNSSEQNKNYLDLEDMQEYKRILPQTIKHKNNHDNVVGNADPGSRQTQYC
jgi:hypothetical protein